MFKTSLFPRIDPKFHFSWLKKVPEAFLVAIPLAKWQEPANYYIFTSKKQ